MKLKSIFLILFIIYTLFLSLGFAETSTSSDKEICEFNGMNYEEALNFVKELHKLIKTNNKRKLANMISFPLRINKISRKSGGKITYYIKTKKEFIEQYHTLISPDMKKVIANDLGVSCNYLGGFTGSGLVWFDTGLGISVINVKR